jgi:hypothetical protein
VRCFSRANTNFLQGCDSLAISLRLIAQQHKLGCSLDYFKIGPSMPIFYYYALGIESMDFVTFKTHFFILILLLSHFTERKWSGRMWGSLLSLDSWGLMELEHNSGLTDVKRLSIKL